MNSYVLLLWLVLANDGRQVVDTLYFNDEVACVQAGRKQVETYARQGKQVAFKCHKTEPEYTGDDIDVNGNPIER